MEKLSLKVSSGLDPPDVVQLNKDVTEDESIPPPKSSLLENPVFYYSYGRPRT